jgi:hypothetical protein
LTSSCETILSSTFMLFSSKISRTLWQIIIYLFSTLSGKAINALTS